jgi:hypothetical protein
VRAQLEDDDVQRIAAAVADLLREQRQGVEHDGWLAPEAAARHLGVSKKRIYDLKSMGAITPDGWDGRTPLFKRQTLDAYAISNMPERSFRRVAP